MNAFLQIIWGLGTLLVAAATSGQNYSIDSLRIDSGGGISSDDVFVVSGTIRRPDAEPISGGGFTVSGEIESIIAAVAAPATGELPPTVEALYAANASNNTIEKFTPEGISSLFASTGLRDPYGLAFDRAGNLYAAGGNSIVKFTPDGVGSLFADTGLITPTGLAFDSAGNLYAANNGQYTIEKFTPDGVRSVFADTLLITPTGLAFDGAGNLYAANGNNTIVKFTPDGGGSVFASTGLNRPVGLAFDSAGNLYVANYGGYTIQKFTPDGVGSVFASSGLNGSYGLAFDSAGNLYAANSGDNTIQKFRPDGAGSVFGNTGLHSPTFIAFARVPSNVVSPPSELRITAVSLSGTELRFSFTTSSGQSYVIESRADLSAGAWAEVPGTRTTSSGAARQLVLPIALGQPQQFYRVQMLP